MLSLVCLFVLGGCCEEALRHDPQNDRFHLPAPLNIGWEGRNGGIYVRHIPNGDWGYATDFHLEGPYAATTKALAVTTATPEQPHVDKFVIYGDGRGVAYAPFEFLAPITVKEIYAKDTQARWPDYVFAPGYPLPSLRELEQYVRRHKHLPGLPSAEEVAQKGVPLMETQRALVQKVEELTLHLIRLQHQVDSLKALLSACR